MTHTERKCRKGHSMKMADCVFSDNYYFKLGISELLTAELIAEHYYIVDIETSNLSALNIWCDTDRRTIAFISTDLDYYTLKNRGDITFISKRSALNRILSCVFLKDSHYAYKVKYKLSLREKEVLSCIQEGLDAEETGQRLGMNTKTFYAHRRSLVAKLRADNRIALYQSITRASSDKRRCGELLLW